ncbi:MAG: hypothetical protein J0M12_04110 [Deltaproteobacteria bacterium]|nr:hypothetical protein [Deltaproteobacteria bacterium]
MSRMIAVSVLVVGVVLQAGCGGGSMGTGVPPRTLQAKAIEKSETPKFPAWLKFRPGPCLTSQAGKEVPVEVESELGAATPLEQRAEVCSFVVSVQAQSLTVRSTWLHDGETISYRLEKVLCKNGAAHALSASSAMVQLSSVEVPQVSISHESYLRLTLTRANGENLALVLGSDQSVQCKETR